MIEEAIVKSCNHVIISTSIVIILTIIVIIITVVETFKKLASCTHWITIVLLTVLCTNCINDDGCAQRSTV